MSYREHGFWGMPCWNGLSAEQQRRLIEYGNLPIGFTPEGSCQRAADLSVETTDDEAPGPRFYCYPCGAEYLAEREAAPKH